LLTVLIVSLVEVVHIVLSETDDDELAETGSQLDDSNISLKKPKVYNIYTIDRAPAV